MLPAARLEGVLSTLPLIQLHTSLYRAVDLERLYGHHASVPYSADALYSLGAARTGARFTPTGGMPTLYLSGDPDTALREATAQAIIVPHVLGAFSPTVQYCCRVLLPGTLDLMDSAVRKALCTSVRELTQPWRLDPDSETQRLGRAAYAIKTISALKYPSAVRPRHWNVAVFPERVASPAFIEVVDPHGNLRARLP